MAEHTIPPEPHRVAIGGAVHDAIVERLDQIPGRPYDPRRFCWLYAAVGARTAHEFLGAGYTMEAGTVDFSIDGRVPLLQGVGAPIAHHAWMTLRRGETCLEVVDLAARHYSFWLAEAAVPVPPGLPRDLVWTLPAELPSGLILTPDPSAAAFIAEFQAKIGRIIDEAATIARHRMRVLGFDPARH